MSGAPGVVIVGAGLIGTSAALALGGQGWQVWLSDRDGKAEALGADISGAQRGLPDSAALLHLGLVCVPPRFIADTLRDLHRLFPNLTLSDVASTKSHVIAEVESSPSLARCFVGGHPIAGRELSGPQAARADLFSGRPWALTPGATASAQRVEQVRTMVDACGAEAVVMTPGEHDAAVALVSHLPQVTSSALAAQLVGQPATTLDLAGQGLRDTTRLAASDSVLWEQILETNAGPVATALRRLAATLTEAAAALETVGQGMKDDKSMSRSMSPVVEVLAAGRRGRALIAGKHGASARSYEAVPVVIPDEPGALGRLLQAAGAAGVNVEDVAIEHSPGQPVGLVALWVEPAAARPLREGLAQAGWAVH